MVLNVSNSAQVSYVLETTSTPKLDGDFTSLV
jgi:hypothetical protein